MTTSGIEWGIFVALVVAGLLAYSGARIRAAHRPSRRCRATTWRPRRSHPRRPVVVASARGRLRRGGWPRPPPLAQQPREGARAPGWLTAPPRRRDEDPTVTAADHSSRG